MVIVVSLALVYVESQSVQMANGNSARRQLGQAGSVSDAGESVYPASAP